MRRGVRSISFAYPSRVPSTDVDFWSGNPAVSMIEGVLRCEPFYPDYGPDVLRSLSVESLGTIKPPPGLYPEGNARAMRGI